MESRHWSTADAKAHFAQVLRDAQSEPQIIENRGKEVAVVLAMSDYMSLRRSQSQSAPGARLADFLREGELLRRDSGPELAIPQRQDRSVPALED